MIGSRNNHRINVFPIEQLAIVAEPFARFLRLFFDSTDRRRKPLLIDITNRCRCRELQERTEIASPLPSNPNVTGHDPLVRTKC